MPTAKEAIKDKLWADLFDAPLHNDPTRSLQAKMVFLFLLDRAVIAQREGKSVGDVVVTATEVGKAFRRSPGDMVDAFHLLLTYGLIGHPPFPDSPRVNRDAAQLAPAALEMLILRA